MQLVKYILVGTKSFLIQLFLLFVLVKYTPLPPTLCSAIGFVVGSFVNYMFQYYWTFRSTGNHQVLFTKFFLIQTLGLMVNASLFWTASSVLGVYYLIAQMFASMCSVLVTYSINRVYTFTH